MVNSVSAGAVLAALAAVAVLTTACDGKTHQGPDPIPEALTVTSVAPNLGNTQFQNMVRIAGTGFQRGAVVTFDGTPAYLNSVEPTLINAVAPPHGEGTVDIVVTHLGQIVRLPGAYTYAGMAVTRMDPATGLNGKIVGVQGFGFAVGATVTMDGISTPAIVQSSTSILILPPEHDPGPVDVVVTNPSGSSWTQTAGYTYQEATLTVSATSVEVGRPLTVSWLVPPGQSADDTIGLFRVEDPISKPVWSEWTSGASSGTLTLTAPTLPGVYDFRYIVEFHGAAVRSSPVTVEPAGP